MEKSERSDATGAKMRPNQKTEEEKSMCAMPAILAAIGKVGQKWLHHIQKCLKLRVFPLLIFRV